MRQDRYSREVTPATVLWEAWRMPGRSAGWVTDKSFTGKVFARLETSEGFFCLRRYPPGTSPQWIEAVHDAVAYLAAHGFQLFPRFISTESGGTLVRHSGQLYDLSEWAMGEQPVVADLGPEHVGNLAGAVGRLHEAGKGASGPQVRFDWLTGRHVLIQRLAWDPVPRGRGEAVWQRPEALHDFFDPLGLPNAATQSDPVAQEVVDAAVRALSWVDVHPPTADLASDPPTLTHGDLWYANVRFSDRVVSALLDLDTLALRPPLGDIAALCANFGDWEAARCKAIVTGYGQIRPITTPSVASLPWLGALRTLAILRERLRQWLTATDNEVKSAALGEPTPYWCKQLRTLAETDPVVWAVEVTE